MTEFRQFLFVGCIILDILCIGIIISIKLKDLEKNDKLKSFGSAALITVILTTSYIVSYLLWGIKMSIKFEIEKK